MFGHFYIKKVPGNFHISTHGKGQALVLFNSVISAGHKIHLLEFTEVILHNFLNYLQRLTVNYLTEAILNNQIHLMEWINTS